MAYILLALGALMSVVGLVAMVTGYPMIEIERGWATVITGAVLLSGGLVVCALGLVVRNLVVLRGLLAGAGALHAAGDATTQQPFVAAPLAPSQPAMPPTPPSFEMPPPRLPADAFDASPGLGVAVPVAAAALVSGAMNGHDERHEPEPRTVDEPLAAMHHDVEALEEKAHATDAMVPEAYVPEVHPPHPSQAHEASDHAPVEATAEPGLPKSHDDWLDQAFSAFDYETTSNHRRPADPSAAAPEPHAEPTQAFESEPEMPEHHEHAAKLDETTMDDAHLEHEVGVQSVEHHVPEPHVPHAEAPATAPAEAAANLAVIGRYDSEGTSYVMYSDGSIEAQSEAGVYRFGSMAELKAFIEN